MATFQPFVEFTSALGTIGLIYFGGGWHWDTVLPIEDLVAFFHLDMFCQPIRALGGAWENVQHAMAGAERVSELLKNSRKSMASPVRSTLPGRARGEIPSTTCVFTMEGVGVGAYQLNIRGWSLVGPTGVKRRWRA